MLEILDENGKPLSELLSDVPPMVSTPEIRVDCPDEIKFEITESLLMTNPELAEVSLKRLNSLGVTLAVDAFGTGYSSFSYLHRFPINTLKIDRVFVSTMLANEKSLKIVRSLTDLAHNLNMNVIAEGVESQEEQQRLQQFGCDFGQGFYFARPIPESEFLQLLQ